MLKPSLLTVPPGALNATAGTLCTKCQPLFPSNEPLPSLNALYVSQLPNVGMRMFPPLPRIRPFPLFGVKSINFPITTLSLTPQFFKVQNTTIANPFKVPNTLGSHFSQISSGSHLSPQFHTLKSTIESTPITFSLSYEAHYNSPFSISELKSALHSCHNAREGPDHIHNLMPKHLPPSSLTFLFVLFNHIWTKGDFPPPGVKLLSSPL